jgi:hypothetical protein
VVENLLARLHRRFICSHYDMTAGEIPVPTTTREQYHEIAQYFGSGKNRWQAKAVLHDFSTFSFCQQHFFKNCVTA